MTQLEYLQYYALPGRFTNSGEHAHLFEGLPTHLPELVKIVQNSLLHVFWTERYGVKLSQVEKVALNLRSASAKLASMEAAGVEKLCSPRSPAQRQVGNCRDFSLLLTTMLRYQGTPARARCGFGTYFVPGRYEDHWVCEVWSQAQQRWVMVDAQLDQLQQQALGIDFDPLDIPPGKFLTGGQAWQMARRGEVDPELFGIFDMHGLWFIAGDLVRDVLALNKVEILPWDHGWGLLGDDAEAGPEPERSECYDRLAELSLPGQEDFAALHALYESEPRLKPPASYFE
jgi:hypothetical protein